MISSTQKTSNATLERAVAMVETSSLVGFDLETTGLDPRKDRIRLASVSNGEQTYLLDAFRIDVRPFFEALAREDLKVLAHAAAFEYGFVYQKYGIALDNLIDTLLLARLAACGDMTIGCKLEEVVMREFELELDKAMQGADWSVETLSNRHLSYAALDVKVLPLIYDALLEAISETGQEHVAKIEHGALLPTALMWLVGMPVDRTAWNAHARDVEAQLRALTQTMLDAVWMSERDPIPQTWALQGADCLAMLHAAGLEGVTGTTAKDLKPYAEDHELVQHLLAYRKAAKGEERENLKAAVLELVPEKPPAPPEAWNFGSWAQVEEICYKILGWRPRSTNESVLLRFVDYHPFFRRELEWRKLAKRVSTYGPNWFKDAYVKELGRVFPNWRQIGTSTGRFSCSTPNVQNVPNDGPYRSFFVAPEGRTFVDVDYSQIEVRVYAKIVEEQALIDLFDRENADVYRSTAAQLLGIKESEVSSEQRQKAKALVLGLLYGLSAAGLPRYAYNNFSVEISPDEAEDLVERFFELYPAIAADHDAVLDELEENGSVDRITLAGRRRDGITIGNEAINAPIQGTAADGLKAAMALLYKRLKKFGGTAFIIAALHDELLVECDEGDAAEVETIVKESMLEAMDKLLNATEPKVRIEVDGGATKVWKKG